MTLSTCQTAGAHPRALTPRQAEVIELARRYHQAIGEWPRATYIAIQLEITHEGARRHISALYRKGWLVRENSPLQLRQFLAAR